MHFPVLPNLFFKKKKFFQIYKHARMCNEVIIYHTIQAYHTIRRGGFILLMDQRRFWPLTPSTPVMLDLYPYVIISMTLGDTILGAFPSLFSKKKKTIQA